MSPKGAEYGVVDPDLLVKGVKGLRIVDAAVIVRVLLLHLGLGDDGVDEFYSQDFLPLILQRRYTPWQKGLRILPGAYASSLIGEYHGRRVSWHR